MLAKRTRSRKGFTLVELLVVIVIIAVLVAIALPRYYQAIYDAKCSTCKSNLKQIDLALHAYYSQLSAATRTWDQVLTDCGGAGADMAGSAVAASTVFRGGFPVCPFTKPYTAEEVRNDAGTVVIGVQSVKADHFLIVGTEQWYDVTDHVP